MESRARIARIGRVRRRWIVRHATRRWDGIPLRIIPCGVVLLVLLFAGYATAAPAPPSDDLRKLALKAEEDHDWLGACRAYDALIRQDRASAEAREGYHRCFRQYQLVRRHSDRAYLDALGRLESSQALDVY